MMTSDYVEPAGKRHSTPACGIGQPAFAMAQCNEAPWKRIEILQRDSEVAIRDLKARARRPGPRGPRLLLVLLHFGALGNVERLRRESDAGTFPGRIPREVEVGVVAPEAHLVDERGHGCR